MKTLYDGGRCHYSGGHSYPNFLECAICSVEIPSGVDYYSANWPTNNYDVGVICEVCIHTPLNDIVEREKRLKGLGVQRDPDGLSCKFCNGDLGSIYFFRWPLWRPGIQRRLSRACKICGEMTIEEATETARLMEEASRMVKALS